MSSPDTLLRIDRARLRALTDPSLVFYGTLAAQLTDVVDAGVDTACTDGRVIRWNPQFVAKLSDAELLFVLLHEVLHCAHGHLWRLPIDDDGNRAGDYEINGTLRRIPAVVMPAGGLYDRRFDGLTCEEILAALKRQQQQQPQQQPGKPQQGDGDGQGTPQSPEAGKSKGTGPSKPSDAGKCGGFTAPAADAPAPEPTPGKPAVAKTPAPSLREQWDRALIQADLARQAMQQGDLPGDIARRLERLRAQRLDWRAETAEFLRATISDRADWSRQARRHATAPVLYPRRRRDDVGVVVFVRDTSGSIGSGVLAQFNGLIRDAVTDLGAEALVIDADARVQAEYRLAAGDEVPDTADGGGGTDFRPVFARVADLLADGETIAGLVYLTDLEGPEPDEVPVPTLWLCTTPAVARTGRTVRVEV